MSDAREHFIGRVDAIRKILASPISTDSTPVPVPNSSAVAVRNGGMVMLFCALEAFVRGRSLECARRINQVVVPYTHLPPGLKYASLVGTFEGLLQQTRYWPDADKMLEFEQATALAAAGKLGSSYQFTEYSFARDKSNVSADDVRDIARSFYVDNLWASCPIIWSKVGAVVPGNADAAYRALSKERHKAAHVATHNVTHTALSDFIPSALALAIAFDILISTGTNSLSNSGIAHGTPPAKVDAANIKLFSVKPHSGNSWAVFGPTSRRALVVQTTREAAFAAAVPRAHAADCGVVISDGTGRPVSWNTILG